MVERRVSSHFTLLRCQVGVKNLLSFLSSLFGLQIPAPQSAWHSASLIPQCTGSSCAGMTPGPGGDPSLHPRPAASLRDQPLLPHSSPRSRLIESKHLPLGERKQMREVNA